MTKVNRSPLHGLSDNIFTIFGYMGLKFPLILFHQNRRTPKHY